MPYKILEENCVSCGTCEVECPVKAIHEGEKCFVIDPEICDNCTGHHETARCALACPNQAPVPDTNHQEKKGV